jgi:UDP-N-acetylglucosamine--N-acetylmuramyl-(pentapeptide) pyrophosphoryl-undecaprenol N-acetylglucosamine transferase
MKVIIATGGTGGHIFVGISLGDELRKNGWDVVFVGSRFGMERKLIPKSYRVVLTSQVPFLGKGIRAMPRFFALLFVSFIESMLILLREHPNRVVGTGGYGSFSLVFIAKILGIPTFITEVDTVPGLATRVLSRLVQEIYLGSPLSKKWVPKNKKVFVTGIPVRSSILERDRDESLKKFGLKPNPTVLVVGGSRGASSISSALCEALEYFPKHLQFILQTGEKDFKNINIWVKKNYSKRVKVFKFIDDMGSAYACADLVVSRAGALAISEIEANSKPAILVPYPYAARDHQLLNAKVLERSGAAKIILDNELDGKVLAEEVLRIVEDNELRKRMQEAAKNLSSRDATSFIVEKISKYGCVVATNFAS